MDDKQRGEEGYVVEGRKRRGMKRGRRGEGRGTIAKSSPSENRL